MTRRPDWIPARRAIPKATIRAVLARSGGMCEAEGCDRVGKEFNHKVGVAFGGADGPDDVELLCPDHHAPHTADVCKRAAKADRQGARSGQQARRAKGKTKQIQSPGFDKTLTRTIPSKNKPSRTVRRET